LIKFSANQEKGIVKRKIFYNSEEKGLDTSPRTQSDITVLIAYMQIGFDSDDMCANQVFGLTPSYSWLKRKMAAPDKTMACALKLDEDFDYGTWRLDKGDEWKSYFDSDSGWLCVGDPDIVANLTNIKFIDNAIATIDKFGELKALWIKPILEKYSV
jgi:hypothetical protein